MIRHRYTRTRAGRRVHGGASVWARGRAGVRAGVCTRCFSLVLISLVLKSQMSLVPVVRNRAKEMRALYLWKGRRAETSDSNNV